MIGFRKKLALIFLLFCGCLTGMPLCATELYNHESKAGSASSLVESRDYVSRYRNDLYKIYNYADSMRKAGRLAEVLHVYESALLYHPDNSVLLRKKILAESDLRESHLLQASGNRVTSNSTESVNKALDQIKCRTLRGSAGISACQRLKEFDPGNSVQNNQQLAQYGGDDSYAVRLPVNQTGNSQLERGIDLGNFHALVIGNNRYQSFNKLETAVDDAKAVAKILKKRYGYQVTRLENANRYEIFQELSLLRKQLGENDNLIIYYAGHGYLDERTKRGYWLPVDAEAENFANWLSTSDITDMLNGMNAKHVLVVADSCYSGTLTRGIKIDSGNLEPDQLAWIKRINDKKSRTVMTSGGLEPVLDSGSGKHSVFAEAFITALENNPKINEAAKMFDQIRRSVILKADQTPEYSDIRKAGHEGGDFIFARVSQ